MKYILKEDFNKLSVENKILLYMAMRFPRSTYRKALKALLGEKLDTRIARLSRLRKIQKTQIKFKQGTRYTLEHSVYIKFLPLLKESR